MNNTEKALDKAAELRLAFKTGTTKLPEHVRDFFNNEVMADLGTDLVFSEIGEISEINESRPFQVIEQITSFIKTAMFYGFEIGRAYEQTDCVDVKVEDSPQQRRLFETLLG